MVGGDMTFTGSLPPAEGAITEGMAGGVDQETILPFARDDAGLLKFISQCFKEAAFAKKETVLKRKEEWNVLANRQWAEPDRQRLERQKRPVLTINLVQTIIAAVEGEERTNRQEMKVYGEGNEDDGDAYCWNRIIKWIMDQCSGEFSLSRQFRSEVAVGEGWVVPEVDYFDDPEGKIKVVFVDDDEMYDDPLATDPTSADSRYMLRVRMMTEQEGEARWPGFGKEIRQNAAAGDFAAPETDSKGFPDIYSTPSDTSSPKLYDSKNKLWAVTEIWWHQIEPGWVVVDESTGLLEEMDEQEFQAKKLERAGEQKGVLDRLLSGQRQVVQPAQFDPVTGATIAPPVFETMPPPLQASKRPIRRFYQAFSTFQTLLERKPCPVKRLRRFPYVPARALWDKEKRSWYGLLRLICDMQRQHNIEQSTMVQWVQSMVKQSWMGPKGSFANKQEWQEKAASLGQMLEYNPQRGKPEQIEAQPIPRHLVDMASSRPQQMRDICGVNVELMGQRQGSDPGVVLEQRQHAAKTVLAPLFDNFRMSKKALGAVLIAYCQTYITVGRQIRVLGEDGKRYPTFTQNMADLRYDITVEETNSTVNDRIATLNLMQTTIPMLVKTGAPIPPSIVDLVPMPPHIRDEWKLMIEWQLAKTGQVPPPGWKPGQAIPPPPGMALPPPQAAPAA